jgi:hypothetical protein
MMTRALNAAAMLILLAIVGGIGRRGLSDLSPGGKHGADD